MIVKPLNRPFTWIRLACISVCVSFLGACSGGVGGSDSTTNGGSTPLTPAPTVSLSANPTSVTGGNASTLTWSSTNATSCTASGAWSGTKATSGSQSSGTLAATSTFSLSCSGTGGSASQSVIVAVNAPPPPPAPTVSLSASPTSVASGASSTLSWSSTDATSCTASGAWSGTKSTSGSQSSGTLAATSTFSLGCTGAGGSSNKSVIVTVNAPPTPAPTVSISANPTSVTSGNAAMLTWSSTDATSCTASGDWSGTKPTSGSASTGNLTAVANTFVLSCSGPGGTTSQLATVMVNASGTDFGLDFPGSAGVVNTMRFRFLNPLAIYPATYIWRAYPKRQAGYYTAFFWGNDDGLGTLDTFEWKSNNADTYYGAHPYPRASDKTQHDWEISIEADDFVNGAVVYDRWYTQALRVWADASGKHHEFYWDLPNTDTSHRVTHTSPTSWGNVNPPVPALTWGDAPWNPGQEVWNGVLRGIQIYSTNLSVADILSEVSSPLSTTAGAANVWYMNLNPTPTDISDKSGAGHNPEWVGSERPLLWMGP